MEDVVLQNLIGDIDPIKAANLKLKHAGGMNIITGYSVVTEHFANLTNCQFAADSNTGSTFFNIILGGDIQIRGFTS